MASKYSKWILIITILLIVSLDLCLVANYNQLVWARIVLALLSLIVYRFILKIEYGPLVNPLPNWKYWIKLGLCILPLMVTALYFYPQKISVNTVTWFYYFGFISPILEEIIYRMVVCSTLLRFLSEKIVIGISTLIFVSLHFFAGGISFTHGLAGIFLGYAYTKSRSLLLVIIFHSIGNILIGLSSFIEKSN